MTKRKSKPKSTQSRAPVTRPSVSPASRRTLSALSGGIMLVGIIVMLILGDFWPWLLVVLALAALPAGMISAGWWGAFPALWLIALAIFIALDWTGIGLAILMLIAVFIAAYNRSRMAQR